MASITAPGVGSGLDINNLVSQLVASEGETKSILLARRESTAQATISGLGSLKSALSGLTNALDGLNSRLDFRARTASSSDEDVLTATASDGAAVAGYQVEVERLAEAHKLATGGYADSAAVVGSGTLTITSGSDTFAVTIDPGADSLLEIRDAINDAAGGSGITATLITVDDGGGGNETKLVLSANETGTANAISVTVDDADGNDTDGTGLSAFVYDPAPGSGVTNLDEINAAVDSLVHVDGQSATRSGNVLDDVIEGLTLNLEGTNLGSPLDVTVGIDRESIEGAINTFISGYNAYANAVSSLSVYEADSGAAGVLLGDATLRSVSGGIRRVLGSEVGAVSGPFNSLASIGISTGADGTLSLNPSLLSSALDESVEDVADLFASESGVAVQLQGVIEPYVRASGSIDSRTESLDARIDRIGEQRAALDRSLVRLEERLLSQFIAMDSLVGRLQNTGNFLTQQLGVLQNIGNNGGNG